MCIFGNLQPKPMLPPSTPIASGKLAGRECTIHSTALSVIQSARLGCVFKPVMQHGSRSGWEVAVQIFGSKGQNRAPQRKE